MGTAARAAWRRATAAATLLATGVLVPAVAQANADPEVGASTRVVGGSATTQGAYPWVVRLSMGCDGALYTRQIVLTKKAASTGNGEWNNHPVSNVQMGDAFTQFLYNSHKFMSHDHRTNLW